MKIAILGGGNVALANACYLASAGHEIHLWSAIAAERDAFARAGRIAYDGFIKGTAPVKAAFEPGAAIKDASVVIIAAPAFAHQTLMEAAAKHLSEQQDVIIHPVTGLSSLLLSRMLRERGIKPTIIDLSTSLFTTRKRSDVSVHILRIKDVIDAATIPSARGEEALVRLESLYGNRFRLERNALAISLNNHNPIYHVPPLLCNLSRAEKKEDWVIWECITPGVARFVKLIDDERLSVVRRYGTTEVSVAQYFRQSWGISGETLDEIFPKVAEKLEGPLGPQDFNHRFVLEDVPYALVFFHALGTAAGIEMPVTRDLIRLTSAIWGRDFSAEGHTLERLGLSGSTPEEILRRSAEGF